MRMAICDSCLHGTVKDIDMYAPRVVCDVHTGVWANDILMPVACTHYERDNLKHGWEYTFTLNAADIKAGIVEDFDLEEVMDNPFIQRVGERFAEKAHQLTSDWDHLLFEIIGELLNEDATTQNNPS